MPCVPLLHSLWSSNNDKNNILRTDSKNNINSVYISIIYSELHLLLTQTMKGHIERLVRYYQTGNSHFIAIFVKSKYFISIFDYYHNI